MKRLNEFVYVLVSVFFLITLSACGGGGSDSGGGGASFAGTYSGTWNATITGAGQSQPAGPGTVTIVINSDNTVVIDPASPVPGTGNISGNTVTASWPAAAFNTSGVTCSGAVSINGTVSGATITGTIGPSTLTCNGIAFTIQGTFTASKTAKALLNGAPVSNEFQNAVRKAMSL